MPTLPTPVRGFPPASDAAPGGRREVASTGGGRAPLVASLRLLHAHRGVVAAFAARSLRVRYKQSVLGVGWALLQPLAFLGLFVVFFGHVAHLSGGGVPYAAFAISALGPWQFVTSALNFGGNSLVNEASLMRKVYFPREAPVLGAIGASLVDLAIITVLMLVVVVPLGGRLGVTLVWLPVVAAALAVPVTAVVLALAGLGVFYRDVKYVLPFLVQFWMYASPVAYPIAKVPTVWRPLYAALNPAVGPLEGFRRILALGQSPDWTLLGISAGAGTALLAGAYRLFKTIEPEMADAV